MESFLKSRTYWQSTSLVTTYNKLRCAINILYFPVTSSIRMEYTRIISWPTTEPCGTPQAIGIGGGCLPSISTECCLFVKVRTKPTMSNICDTVSLLTVVDPARWCDWRCRMLRTCPITQAQPHRVHLHHESHCYLWRLIPCNKTTVFHVRLKLQNSNDVQWSFRGSADLQQVYFLVYFCLFRQHRNQVKWAEAWGERSCFYAIRK